MLPFGLRNAAETVAHPMAQRTPPPPANDEFVEMTEYIADSFHDLLAGELESPSNSNSSRGSHHPSRECFMAGTPEGYVESIHEGGLPQQTTSMMRSRGIHPWTHCSFSCFSTPSSFLLVYHQITIIMVDLDLLLGCLLLLNL